MSWNLVNNNSNLDLYCNNLRCSKIIIPTDTDGIISLSASFYTGSSSLDYTEQRAGITVKYQVFNGYMYIFMRTSTGIWNIIPNPSGTGWSNMKLGPWNSGAPIGLNIPYKVNSADNIYSCDIITISPSNVFNSTRVKIDSSTSGFWGITLFPINPLTQFNNNQSFSVDNFCLVVPVIKL